MADIKYEIKQNLGTLSESSKGWTKELNLVSWNNKEPKYDLRDWDPTHNKMGKGVTLTAEELKKIVLHDKELQIVKSNFFKESKSEVKYYIKRYLLSPYRKFLKSWRER